MKRRSIRHALVAGSLLLVLVLVPAGFAAKGGNGGGGKPGAAGPTATLYSSCNPCTAGTVASFWGSGFDGSQGTAQLSVSGTWAAVPVAADGSVAFSWYLSAAGTYDLKLYQSGNGRKSILKGALTVVAQ